MSIRTYNFTISVNDESKDFADFKEFINALVDGRCDFEVVHDVVDARTLAPVVKVTDIVPSIAKDFAEFEDVEYEDEEDDYHEPADLEVGFNPYMGSYDFDC